MASGDRHREGRFLAPIWLDNERRQRAADILREHGWTLTDFLSACLRLLLANPAPFLRRLSEVREMQPKGRPRKDA